MTGTRARSQASLIRALNAWLLKGAPSRPGKIKGDPAKSTPSPRSRTPFTLSRKANHSSSEADNSFVTGRSRKQLPFNLKACSDNHPSGFTDEPVYRESRPLVKSATGKKERGGEMVCQMPKVATAIIAQLAQKLPQLGGGVITQLDFLRREFGSRALGEWICGT
jgi:hypothetical protein